MRKTIVRLAAALAALAASLVAATPAAAWYGDVSTTASTRVALDAFGAAVPAGFAEYWNETVTGGASGTASSSYRWPPPPPDWGLAYLGCPDTGCVSGDARAHASVDRAAGTLRAVASGHITTGGVLVSNAGFNQTQGVAEIADTITLSEPATVVLEGTLGGRLGFTHSHQGWYGDPRASVRARISFTGVDPDAGEWPYVDLGGLDEEYQAEAIYSCPYPATCALDPSLMPGPQVVADTFAIEVELPAGTSFFSASLRAAIDMQVWGARGDAYRSAHGMSAQVDFGNTATFRIVVPEGVVATSGSGQLPIVGGSSGGGDPEDPEDPEPTPAEQLDELRGTVGALAVQPAGVRTALLAKLDAAASALAAGDVAGACSALQDFVRHLRAQSGKKVSAATAAELTVAADAIRAALGCA